LKKNIDKKWEIIISIPASKSNLLNRETRKRDETFPQFYQFQTPSQWNVYRISFIYVHLDKYHVSNIEVLMLPEKKNSNEFMLSLEFLDSIGLLLCLQ
jgi:hypothetical protein